MPVQTSGKLIFEGFFFEHQKQNIKLELHISSKDTFIINNDKAVSGVGLGDAHGRISLWSHTVIGNLSSLTLTDLVFPHVVDINNT